MSHDRNDHLHRRPGPRSADDLRRRAGPAGALPVNDTVRQAPSNSARAGAVAQSPEEQRVELFRHIQTRLGVVRAAQLKEDAAMANPRKDAYKRPVADNHAPEHSRPDPSRWHAAADLYRAAADALVRGDLARGAGLLRSAEEAERAAYVSTSAVVDLDGVPLLTEQSPPRQGALGHLGTTALPEGIRETHNRILSTRPWMSDLPVKELDTRPPVLAEVQDEEEGEDATRARR